MKKKILSLILSFIIIMMSFTAVYADNDTQYDDVQRFVIRLYESCLGRGPDATGLADWTNRLKTGAESGSRVAYGFVFSNEYLNRNTSNEEYVTMLYYTFMDRGPDSIGFADWTGRLASGSSRESVFNGFANSVEFAGICERYGITRGDSSYSGNTSSGSSSSTPSTPTPSPDSSEGDGYTRFAERLYTKILGRASDPNGIADWSNRLRTHQVTFSSCALGFLHSQEFLSRAVSDTEYVTILYRTFLDREPDAAGLADWTGRLSRGASRDSIIDGFANSTEFRTLCASYVAGNGHVVCIDPGHSGVIASGTVPIGPGSTTMKAADAGGTYGRWSNVSEYVLTLQIAQQLRTELESRGYTVIMTREDNNTPVDCVTRAQIANNGADISIRLHADALSGSSANGATAICIASNNPWNPQTYSGSRRLAECLLNSYCPATGIRSRGVSEQNDMTGNNWSTVPCVLFEMGFMTNQSDDLYMTNANNQPVMVRGLADGIDAYFAS